ALASVGPSTTYREVEAHLRAAGWTPCGAGDWAFALASPGGDVVARISPFDPVGPYTARLYREAAGTELVPRLLAHHRLAGGADLQVMERLEEVPEAAAAECLERLARPVSALSALAAVVRSAGHEHVEHHARGRRAPGADQPVLRGRPAPVRPGGAGAGALRHHHPRRGAAPPHRDPAGRLRPLARRRTRGDGAGRA